MVANKNSAAKFAAQIMRLEFFANRFGLPKSKLRWGILLTRNEEGQCSADPVILITGENLVIDIVYDNIVAPINVCGCSVIPLQAKCDRVRAGYRLAAGSKEVFLSYEKIKSIYRSKIFSKELAENAKQYDNGGR